MKAFLVLFGSVSCIACLAGCAAFQLAKEPVRLGGKITETDNPNSHWRVLSADATADGKPVHKLYLMNKQSGDQMDVAVYEREATVLWSPSGKRLLVNTYTKHDSGTCWLVLPEEGKTVNLADEFAKTPWGKSLRGPHAYLEGRRWKSNDVFEVFAHSRGAFAGSGYTKWLTYEIGKGFKKPLFGNFSVHFGFEGTT